MLAPRAPFPLVGETICLPSDLFGAGTIVGMMLVTAATALPFTYTLGRFAALNRRLVLASGAASIGFGLFLVYRIGVADGLFIAPPE